ncbi:dihydroxyacetone kinase phosphoryl donor subunit DhaM [Succinatimonas hippei]|uniref:phosphoenolpyruvate--glycerone phosphotransferase n=1 Tax=Succinatimonas hippei (strain DSM 22608 / JCM 16073 / KCTC 15190 / YIT 12066) TaxID=762983 RepID=E8LHI7_SUCHY|nr:dihydroxyacetone kinase phosphoryl donor subunit DhaM [Succinatimonas hippei]EFY08006.1 dihydroxyacetone kinase, phosphotransfer subunit [Succinatimonas hippei YIT 12066]MCL1603191.1 dihydroxyacetone kinase phosphoryl donor subunit DhaM [Succinatimonas hippei]MDM8119250.1 dihydroxyacetone kinase phosphoryl donor subunit DhaM [Succinatimonas hippei]
MIGIVVVSHSSKVAEGICDMVQQISSRDGEKLPIYPAGGNAQGGLGTDPQRVLEAIKKADQGEGVVVLADLGSAVISSQAAISMLDEPLRSRVRIADAPVLEGAIGAGVEAASDDVSSLDLVVSTAEGSRQLHKK